MANRPISTTDSHATKVGNSSAPNTNRFPDARSRRVVVVGAGIAGMTAAHELAERGYQVTVIEAAQYPGGKAATQYPWVEFKKEADRARIQVPAEHGFRLFPSFYRHVIDTMSRIPFDRRRQPALSRLPADNPPSPDVLGRNYDTVADNLLPTQFAAMARHGSKPRTIPRAYGRTLDGFLRMVEDLSSSLQFSEAGVIDAYRFQLKCLQFISSCSQRRDDIKSRNSYGNKTWWQFLGGDRFFSVVPERDRYVCPHDGRHGRAQRQCADHRQRGNAADHGSRRRRREGRPRAERAEQRSMAAPMGELPTRTTGQVSLRRTSRQAQL